MSLNDREAEASSRNSSQRTKSERVHVCSSARRLGASRGLPLSLSRHQENIGNVGANENEVVFCLVLHSHIVIINFVGHEEIIENQSIFL